MALDSDSLMETSLLRSHVPMFPQPWEVSIYGQPGSVGVKGHYNTTN